MQTFWLSRPFWVLSLGLFLQSYAYGVAAIAVSWVDHPGWVPTVLLICSPLGLSAGIGLGGYLADWWGRRRLLRLGPLGYMAGALCLLSGATLPFALAGSLCLMVTAGVESNTILTYAQEMMPLTLRRRAMYTELNFVNLGGVALVAATFLGTRMGIPGVRPVLTIVPFVLGMVSLLIRRPVRESALWERSKKQIPLRQVLTSSWLRFSVAATFSFANTAGFSLLSYALGAEFLPRYFHYVLLVSTTTAFLIGLLARWFSLIPARLVLIIGYGTALFAAVGLYMVKRPSHAAFWIVLFILSAATSMSYLAEDTFKTHKWPSALRGRMIGAVRITGLLGYTLTLVLVRNETLAHFLLVIVMVWALGFAASIVWWLKGTHALWNPPSA